MPTERRELQGERLSRISSPKRQLQTRVRWTQTQGVEVTYSGDIGLPPRRKLSRPSNCIPQDLHRVALGVVLASHSEQKGPTLQVDTTKKMPRAALRPRMSHPPVELMSQERWATARNIRSPKAGTENLTASALKVR